MFTLKRLNRQLSLCIGTLSEPICHFKRRGDWQGVSDNNWNDHFTFLKTVHRWGLVNWTAIEIASPKAGCANTHRRCGTAWGSSSLASSKFLSAFFCFFVFFPSSSPVQYAPAFRLPQLLYLKVLSTSKWVPFFLTQASIGNWQLTRHSLKL